MLAIALGIFAWLAAKSRNVKSFQFQISLFILIWIIGEIIDLMGEEGFIQQLSTGDLDMYIHLLGMATFSAMLWIRFFMSEKRGKRLEDTFQGS